MNADAVVRRLSSSGFALPDAQEPQYSYDAVVEGGGLAHVSGQIPKTAQGIAYTGRVGAERSLTDGVKAAEICLLNVLAQLHAGPGFDRVERVLRITVYVASAPDFYEQPEVAEGASALLTLALDADGRHARTALAVPQLPKNATVEIDAVAALRPNP